MPASPGYSARLAAGAARPARHSVPTWRLQLEFFGVAASGLMQLLHLLRQKSVASQSENRHLMLIVVYHLLVLTTMLGRRPTLYSRFRVPIYALMRPLGYLSPTVRNTRHAAAQLLAGPATPGPWGALVDLKRLMLASRVWGTAVIGLVVAVDPVVALLVQALCSYLSAANTGYCTTQMMADPLTKQRVEAFSSAMDLLSLPFSAMVPLPKNDPGTIARQCTAAIFFLQVTVGVLLPLYILCCSMRELTLPPSLPVPTTSSWGQLQRGAAWAYAASNRAVWHAFCAARTSLLPPTLVLWLAVALSWTATLLLHGL